MPDFTIRGNPGAIRSRAALTADKGALFDGTGEALAKVDVSGWTGRAADHFREAHDLEPERWFEAGQGFRRAGAALLAYADAVEQAQQRAAWAEQEYARGEQASTEYRGWFDSESSRLRTGLANGTYSSITLPVWDDPGAEIRSAAVAELEAARSGLDAAAQACAAEVRAGCAAAPEEPAWWESGLKFVGGIFVGAGEALWDLATMLPFSPANLVQDAWKLSTGELTPEELATTYELDVETVQGMWQALQDDPVEFGKNLGKGLLDWDTWADDPARAIGHLVPDAVAAVATAGTGALATRGAGSIDDIADGMRAIDRMDDAADLRNLDELGELGDLGRLDRLDDGLRDLVRTPVEDLSPEQARALVEARDAFTVEPGTPMQRVISADDAADYLRGESSTNTYFRPDQTFGFTAREADVGHLRTPQEIFDGLGLDYEGTSFRDPGDLAGPNQGGDAVDRMHLLRYEASGPDDVIVPRDSSLGGDGAFDGQARDPDNPFTGNGFTKGGIPEWRTDGPTDLPPGSEIWRTNQAGDQVLVAVLDDSGEWLAVPR